MDRRGVTLLELMIAISLLVAIAAIAVPVVVTSLDEGEYDSAVEVTKAALLRARAHAQATGRPIEVMYRPDPARIEARVFDIETGGLEEEEVGALVAEDWAYRPLAASVRLTRVAPEETLPGGSGAFPIGDLPADLEAETADVSLRLAVYLPDGSAMLTEPAWIVADDGSRGRLVVNPWSGLPRLDAGGATLSEDEDEDEDEEEEEEEEEDEGEKDEPGPIEDDPEPEPQPERDDGAPGLDEEDRDDA